MESIFDKLVREIPTEERQSMLDKINKTIGSKNEPMWYEENSDLDIPIQTETFGQLSLLSRIKIMLIEFFTGQKRENLIKILAASSIRKRLARKVPHFVDLNKGLFYPEFHGILVNLQSAVKVFNPIVTKIMSLQKSDFYGYLFKVENEDIHNKLEMEIDPERLIPANPDAMESEIKTHLKRSFNEIVENIDRERRMKMMSHALILSRLHGLSVFPYERLISLFEKSQSDSISSASLTHAKIPLMELGDAICSFQTPPSAILLETMFLFSIESSLEEGSEKFNFDANLSVFMKSAGDALALIRDVNKKVPWLDLLKGISGDAHYVPYSEGGGEEWFQYFKIFWNKRMETKYHTWLQKRKQSEYISEFKNLWGVSSISLLAGYRNEDYQENIDFQHAHSIAVIKTMFLDVFPGKLYHVLSRVTNKGKFYKDNNKRDFDETFLHFIRAQDKIKGLGNKLREDGEYRIKLNSLFRGSSTKKERSQMIQNWVYDIDREGRKLVHSCTEDIELMSKLLKGIVSGKGEDYDTLSNIKEVADSTEAVFQKELEKAHKIVSRTAILLRELLALEGDDT